MQGVFVSCAPVRNRTRDPLITSQVLYHLSYKGELEIIEGKDEFRHPYLRQVLQYCFVPIFR
jgi:hypothetical protein